MIALTFKRSVPRYIASRVVAKRAPGMLSNVSALSISNVDEPTFPSSGWVRVAPILSGICGSDLAMIAGDASFYFGPIVSMPFVPGHEIVGTLLDDTPTLKAGSRVVIQPVLGCEARGVTPLCGPCSIGHVGNCHRTANGHVSPGLQTGFCSDTGGGWGQQLVAHHSQLHEVPEGLRDEEAVLIEPLACAIHGVLRADIEDDDTVLVTGAGTMGLLTIAAIRSVAPSARIIAAAKHPVQRTQALRLGADDVTDPRSATRAVRLATASLMREPERGAQWLAGGADVSIECAGNMGALDTCLRSTRMRGRVVLLGLPATGAIDLAPVWHRELELRGAYTYGQEDCGSHTFDLAFDLAQRVDLAPLVSAAYPLSRYAEAIDHAADAGRLDAVKVVFSVA